MKAMVFMLYWHSIHFDVVNRWVANSHKESFEIDLS